MYTLFDPKPTWPMATGQSVYCGMYNGGMLTNNNAGFQPFMTSRVSLSDSQRPVLYSLSSPPWYRSSQSPPSPPTKSRCRLPSDDVFLPPTPVLPPGTPTMRSAAGGRSQLHDPRVFSYDFHDSGHDNLLRPSSPNGSLDIANSVDSYDTSSCSGDDSSESSRSYDLTSGSTLFGLTPPRKPDYAYNMSTDTSPASAMYEHQEPTFACDQRDMDEAFFAPPFSTSVAKHPMNSADHSSMFNSNYSSQIMSMKFGKNKGRMITSRRPNIDANPDAMTQYNSYEQSQDFAKNRQDQMPDVKSKKRADFLRTLQNERERQRKLVLPKFTPKMSCKFCKNNGECPEVFTKHRLHLGETTLCPLLRHYVCRLCGKTGDKAHTIRHCPLNNKRDKFAWKATFLE